MSQKSHIVHALNIIIKKFKKAEKNMTQSIKRKQSNNFEKSSSQEVTTQLKQKRGRKECKFLKVMKKRWLYHYIERKRSKAPDGNWELSNYSMGDWKYYKSDFFAQSHFFQYFLCVCVYVCVCVCVCVCARARARACVFLIYKNSKWQIFISTHEKEAKNLG